MTPFVGGQPPRPQQPQMRSPSPGGGMMNQIYQPGTNGTGGGGPMARPPQPQQPQMQRPMSPQGGPPQLAGPSPQPQMQQPMQGGSPQPQGQYAQATQSGMGADVLKPLPTQYGGPQITQGPVMSQGQIQAQVGRQQGMNAVRAGQQTRSNQQGMAARGFGAGSPALAAMNQQAQFARGFADQEAATQIPAQYAQMNAQHQLATQQAGANQYGNRVQEELARRQQAGNYETNFMNMIMGMAG